MFITGSLRRAKHTALKAISKQNSKQYFRIKRKLYAHSYLPGFRRINEGKETLRGEKSTEE